MESAAHRTIPHASTADNLRLLLFQVLPTYLQGLFTRNRFWTGLFSALHPDPLAVRFLSRLRRKYGSDCVLAKLARSPTLLVFDLKVVRHVLDSSPDPYADPDAKHRGMSRFQPYAVTISRGYAWRQRRRFNESILGTGGLHPLADAFSAVVKDEVGLLSPPPVELRWRDFETLFQRITLSVIFGRAAADDNYLWHALGRLMRNANRSGVFPPKPTLFESFYSAMRGYLRHPASNCLAALIRDYPADRALHVESQIPHWMFAMSETLAINSVRALALVAAHADIACAVRRDIANAPLESLPSDRTDEMSTVSSVLQEAMRLWPTTPYIMRRLTASDVVCGEELPARTQVMIVNGWFHRAPDSFRDGDNVVPGLWAGHQSDERFNHMSNGRQFCAGRDLAVFLGTEIMAQLLNRYRFELKRPRIASNRPMPESFNHFRIRLRGRAL